MKMAVTVFSGFMMVLAFTAPSDASAPLNVSHFSITRVGVSWQKAKLDPADAGDLLSPVIARDPDDAGDLLERNALIDLHSGAARRVQLESIPEIGRTLRAEFSSVIVLPVKPTGLMQPRQTAKWEANMANITARILVAAAVLLLGGTSLSKAQELDLGVDYGPPAVETPWGLGADTTFPEPTFEEAPSLPSVPFIDVPIIKSPDVEPFAFPIPDVEAPGFGGGVKTKDGSIFGTFQDKPNGGEGKIIIKVPNPLSEPK